MIEHIVLFKWKTEATSEQINAAIENLRGLKDKIPGIIDLSCGDNFGDRSQGFQHGLVVRFDNKAALDAYQTNHFHQEVVVNLIRPILADILAVDYEI